MLLFLLTSMLSEFDFLSPCAATLRLKTEKASAHRYWIRSVAFSPDGKTIVSVSDDQALKVWDAGAVLYFRLFAFLLLKLAFGCPAQPRCS